MEISNRRRNRTTDAAAVVCIDVMGTEMPLAYSNGFPKRYGWLPFLRICISKRQGASSGCPFSFRFINGNMGMR